MDLVQAGRSLDVELVFSRSEGMGTAPTRLTALPRAPRASADGRQGERDESLGDLGHKAFDSHQDDQGRTPPARVSQCVSSSRRRAGNRMISEERKLVPEGRIT